MQTRTERAGLRILGARMAPGATVSKTERDYPLRVEHQPKNWKGTTIFLEPIGLISRFAGVSAKKQHRVSWYDSRIFGCLQDRWLLERKRAPDISKRMSGALLGFLKIRVIVFPNCSDSLLYSGGTMIAWMKSEISLGVSLEKQQQARQLYRRLAAVLGNESHSLMLF